jgi:hypothetical protein
MGLSPSSLPETPPESPSLTLSADHTIAVAENLADAEAFEQEAVADAIPLPDQPAPKRPPTASPQRREYRRLFAQLLQG